MKLRSLTRKLTKITAMATSSVIAANVTGPIGAVEATGGFLLNGVQTVNHATLPDGAIIENSRASSEIHINGGTYLILSQDTKAEIRHDGATLLRGSAQIADAKEFAVTANGFKVVSNGKDNTLVVALDSAVVRVGALKGQGRVLDSNGGLVAQVTPGMSVSLKAGTAGPQSMKLAGTLTQRNGHFYVEDQVSHTRVEVTGKNFSSWVGQDVKLAGSVIATAPEKDVAYTVKVDSIDKLPAGAVVAGGTAAAVGAAGTGAAIGTTTAVVGGIAVAGATAGTVAAVKMKSEPSKPLSK